MAIYRPPDLSLPWFLDDFTEFMVDIIADSSNIVVMGDFNIHVNCDDDPNAVIFSDTMKAIGLHQHVTGPTHRSGNTLDLIFTEELSKIKLKSCKSTVFVSDHTAVHCILDIQYDEPSKQEMTFRKLSSINIEKFIEDIPIISLDIEDLNTLVSSLEMGLRSTLDLHAPELTKFITVRKKKPWYNEELRKIRCRVRRAEKLYRRHGTTLLWKLFDTIRTEYKQNIKKSKIQTYTRQVADCKGDTKKLYNLVYRLMGKEKSSPLPDHTDEESLANDFANYFMSKIEKIREELEGYILYKPQGRNVREFSNFRLFSDEEVRTIIMGMKTKSCEMDPIPTELLKKCIVEVLPTITKIINISLRDGVFVDGWKTAIIRPLLKSFSLEIQESASYCPVSNLPFLSKVLEKCVMDRFNEHCRLHSALPEYQSAYRQDHSCETSILKLVNDILWAMERQECTAVMACDLSAAFDTIHHGVLLEVMSENFGVKNTALLWFDSYLRPRSCKVNIGKSYSSNQSLDFSVPQGSCAGAQLFNVYSSTLTEVVKPSLKSNVYGFADDHSVWDSFKAKDRADELECIGRLEDCAVDLKQWMDQNRLRMNSKKTEFILFGSSVQLAKCTTESLNVNGEIIPMVNMVKQLGVFLDQNLNFKHHIMTKCTTAMASLAKIKGIRNYLTKEAAETLVLSMAILHLDYCNGILTLVPDVDIKHMQLVQNIAAKLVLGKSKSDSSSQCLRELHWLPIKQRIQYKILCLVHKCLDCKAPKYLQDLLVHYPYEERRRGLRCEFQQARRLVEPRTKLKTFGARSFASVGPRWWNKLPNTVKTVENHEQFKISLKTFLLTTHYGSLIINLHYQNGYSALTFNNVFNFN